jgi:predicted aldo/keto reductase-like oxidoreductase
MQKISLASGMGAMAGSLPLMGASAVRAISMADYKERLVDDAGKIPHIQLGDRMGKMMVSRIVISQDWNPALYAPALAMGVNFVHKAGYWNHLPDEFKAIPRESYYTDITVDSTPNNPDNEDQAYSQVTQSLDRTGLQYFDIFRAHFGWRTVEAFKTQTGTYKAFQRLKREGKVRHFGVSQHGVPGDGGYRPYPEMIQALIDSDIIEHMQVFFSASTPPDVMEAFARASKAGIGMTAMKTFAQGSGAMRNNPDLQKQLGAEGKIGRACIRYALTTKHALTGNKSIFQCCVSSIGNTDIFEENLGAVATLTAMRDGFVMDV